MKRKIIWGVVVLVVVGAIAGVSLSRRGPKPKPVQLAKVARQDLQAKVSANGKVQATKKVDISATVPGQVVQLAVARGTSSRRDSFFSRSTRSTTGRTPEGSQFSMQALQKDLDAAQVRTPIRPRPTSLGPSSNHAAGILADADLQRARTDASTSRRGLDPRDADAMEQARATVDGVTELRCRRRPSGRRWTAS